MYTSGRVGVYCRCDGMVEGWVGEGLAQFWGRKQSRGGDATGLTLREACTCASYGAGVVLSAATYLLVPKLVPTYLPT